MVTGNQISYLPRVSWYLFACLFNTVVVDLLSDFPKLLLQRLYSLFMLSLKSRSLACVQLVFCQKFPCMPGALPVFSKWFWTLLQHLPRVMPWLGISHRWKLSVLSPFWALYLALGDFLNSPVYTGTCEYSKLPEECSPASALGSLLYVWAVIFCPMHVKFVYSVCGVSTFLNLSFVLDTTEECLASVLQVVPRQFRTDI